MKHYFVIYDDFSGVIYEFATRDMRNKVLKTLLRNYGERAYLKEMNSVPRELHIHRCNCY